MLKPPAKNEKGVTLRMDIKIFNGNNLSNELYLITRQKIKLTNVN